GPDRLQPLGVLGLAVGPPELEALACRPCREQELPADDTAGGCGVGGRRDVEQESRNHDRLDEDGAKRTGQHRPFVTGRNDPGGEGAPEGASKNAQGCIELRAMARNSMHPASVRVWVGGYFLSEADSISAASSSSS